jgi:hypothetical protein
MGGMGDMKDERDIRMGREREASQWPYPPRMDTPLWLQPLCTHQRGNRSSTQTRGEDTWMPAQICSFLGSTEISAITGPEDDSSSLGFTCDGEIDLCLLWGTMP